MKRRHYLAVMAAMAGCTEADTMPESEAEKFGWEKEFDDVVKFKPPIDPPHGADDVEAKRFVDSEAGVVIWAIEGQRYRGGGIGITSMELADTYLEVEQ